MKIKSKLLLALTKKIQSWNVTQKEAAGRLGITQPRVNEILTGRISSITLDRLLALLDRANLEVSIDIHDKVAAAA